MVARFLRFQDTSVEQRGVLRGGGADGVNAFGSLTLSTLFILSKRREYFHLDLSLDI